jgi:hypothetical protein
MDLAPEVMSYAATEVISTDIRGKATNMRKFNKRKQPNETITRWSENLEVSKDGEVLIGQSLVRPAPEKCPRQRSSRK